jgi:hypothetical protein
VEPQLDPVKAQIFLELADRIEDELAESGARTQHQTDPLRWWRCGCRRVQNSVPHPVRVTEERPADRADEQHTRNLLHVRPRSTLNEVARRRAAEDGGSGHVRDELQRQR